MSDDDTRHSGSRWEPVPSVPARAPGQDDLVDGPGADPTTQRIPTVGGGLEPIPAPASTPRRSRRRAGLLAAAAAGLLAVGGLGGYAVGHATASTPGGAGLAGAGGGFGHHRAVGPDGALPGRPGDDGSTDSARGGAGGPNAGGTGTGGTGSGATT